MKFVTLKFYLDLLFKLPSVVNGCTFAGACASQIRFFEGMQSGEIGHLIAANFALVVAFLSAHARYHLLDMA